METDNVFFCDIVPVVPIPLRNRQAYSYLSASPVSRGSLVYVPFGPRTVRGVVLACTEIAAAERPSGRFKYVKSVIRESFLTDAQISLAETVSNDCLTPLGKTLRHFLPAIVTERVRERPDVAARVLRPSDREQEIREAFRKHGPRSPLFLRGKTMEALAVLAAEKRATRSRKPMLVLVPEIAVIPFVERFFREIFGNGRIAVLDSRRSAGAFFSAWERIRTKEADIVIGTRQAVFAPFSDLSFILVLGEGEVLGYKQWDMSPRYDARRVVERLATTHAARLVFSDAIESLDMRLRIANGSLIPLPSPKETGAADVSLVNMREERWKKNRSIVSETVRVAIADALKWNRASVVIASRGGLDSFSVCESCKTVPRCLACERALRSTRDGRFACPSCAYKTTPFPRCRTCGSLAFRNVGSGTEKIEKELARAFPSSRIVRIDEAAIRKEGSLRPDSLVDTVMSADILIGTPALLNMPYLPDAGPVAIMDTDDFLALPDFRGDERFLRMIALASGFAGRFGSGGRLYLQTFHPERDFFDRIRSGDLETPLRSVGLDREALGYPPYRSLFRIVFRDTTEAGSIAAATDASDRLARVAKMLPDTTVSAPVTPLSQKVRGRYERSILVTIGSGLPFPEPMRDVLTDGPGSWVFEPDPLTVL